MIFLLNTYTIILYSLECFNLISQFKIDFVSKISTTHCERCFLILSWTDFIWFERLHSSPNSALQSEQWCGFFFSWTVEMCCNNFFLWEMIYLVWFYRGLTWGTKIQALNYIHGQNLPLSHDLRFFLKENFCWWKLSGTHKKSTCR